MKIRPTPQAFRAFRHDRRSGGEAVGRAVAVPAPTLWCDDALRARDAAIRRISADPALAVLGAAACVAQQIGQILAAEDEASSDAGAAAYRRCEETVGNILRPPMESAGFVA